MMGVQVYRHESDTPLPTGEVSVRLEFHADAAKPATGGDVRLFANGQEIGKGRMDHTVPFRFSASPDRPGQRRRRRPQLRGRARTRSPEPSRRSSSTSSRTCPATMQTCTNPPTTGTWPTASTDDQPTAANRGRCQPSTAAGIYG